MNDCATAGNGKADSDAKDRCRQLRLTQQSQDQTGYTSERHSSKENGIAVVPPEKPKEQEEKRDLRFRTEVEIIKIFIKPHEPAESVRMLTDEVSQIQEVRYCLKTLRQQMAARQTSNNNKYPANGFRVNGSSSQPAVSNGNCIHTDTNIEDNQEESVRLREVTRCLYAQLREVEKQHQEEKDRLQAESNEYRTRLAKQTEWLQKAEEQSAERGQQVENLRRLLESMEIEKNSLQKTIDEGKEELLQLKADREKGAEKEQRCAELENEVATLKEKIHHLDDMLMSQQRKVRHMIEQLQNSRTVLQGRDQVIRDLEERVAFLEAENREMHDRIEFFQLGQDLSTENKPEVIYSKPLTPTTPSSKALPFIKVIEIKS